MIWLMECWQFILNHIHENLFEIPCLTRFNIPLIPCNGWWNIWKINCLQFSRISSRHHCQLWIRWINHFFFCLCLLNHFWSFFSTFSFFSFSFTVSLSLSLSLPFSLPQSCFPRHSSFTQRYNAIQSMFRPQLSESQMEIDSLQLNEKCQKTFFFVVIDDFLCVNYDYSSVISSLFGFIKNQKAIKMLKNGIKTNLIHRLHWRHSINDEKIKSNYTLALEWKKLCITKIEKERERKKNRSKKR